MTKPSVSVLVTSLSSKVPLLREVRKALSKVGVPGRLIGGDTNEQAIGRYFVDDFWEMPRLDELPIDELVAYCREAEIAVIIPTRDGELSYFARHRALLAEAGVVVMISQAEGVQTCLDKLAFYEGLQGHPQLCIIPTATDPSRLNAQSYVVKERFGAGAKEILLDVSRDEARAHAASLEAPLFQSFIKGKEYSIDVYVAQQGRPKGAVVRSRDVVVHGESQVTTTVRMPKLEQAAMVLVEALGLTGHVICQAIKDSSNNFRFIECNCRFGGASTLSVAAGLDSFYWFLLECQGDDLTQHPFVRSSQELRQIRYLEDLVIHDPGI